MISHLGCKVTPYWAGFIPMPQWLTNQHVESALKFPWARLPASHGVSLLLLSQIGLGYSTSGIVHIPCGMQPGLTSTLAPSSSMTGPCYWSAAPCEVALGWTSIGLCQKHTCKHCWEVRNGAWAVVPTGALWVCCSNGWPYLTRNWAGRCT